MAQRHAQQCAEGLDHRGNILVAQRFGAPVDRIQCVVQEVRIDLAFQKFELRVLGQQLIDIVLLDQILHMHGHLVKAAVQLADFIAAAAVVGVALRQGRLVLTKGVHLADQCGKMPGDDIDEVVEQHQAEQQHDEHDEQCKQQ